LKTAAGLQKGNGAAESGMKRCWECFAYPNLRIFKSLDGAFEAILEVEILAVFSLKSAFLTFLEKQVHEPKPAYKL